MPVRPIPLSNVSSSNDEGPDDSENDDEAEPGFVPPVYRRMAPEAVRSHDALNPRACVRHATLDAAVGGTAAPLRQLLAAADTSVLDRSRYAKGAAVKWRRGDVTAAENYQRAHEQIVNMSERGGTLARQGLVREVARNGTYGADAPRGYTDLRLRGNTDDVQAYEGVVAEAARFFRSRDHFQIGLAIKGLAIKGLAIKGLASDRKAAHPWRGAQPDEVVNTIYQYEGELPPMPDWNVAAAATRGAPAYRKDTRRTVYDVGAMDARPLDDPLARAQTHVRILVIRRPQGQTTEGWVFPAMTVSVPDADLDEQVIAAEGYFYSGPNLPLTLAAPTCRLGEIPRGAVLTRTWDDGNPIDTMQVQAVEEVGEPVRRPFNVAYVRDSPQRIFLLTGDTRHIYGGRESPLGKSAQYGPIVPRNSILFREVPRAPRGRDGEPILNVQGLGSNFIRDSILEWRPEADALAGRPRIPHAEMTFYLHRGTAMVKTVKTRGGHRVTGVWRKLPVEARQIRLKVPGHHPSELDANMATVTGKLTLADRAMLADIQSRLPGVGGSADLLTLGHAVVRLHPDKAVHLEGDERKVYDALRKKYWNRVKDLYKHRSLFR